MSARSLASAAATAEPAERAEDTLARPADLRAEWLETDGLGGFASGAVDGLRRRRYHAVLLAARRPPVDRMVLVNGVEAWLETPAGRMPLSRQHYVPDVVSPAPGPVIESFAPSPWPRWTFRLEDGTRVAHELFVRHGSPLVVLTWRRSSPAAGPLRLVVRPLLSGRDYHALHHENDAFWFDAEVDRQRVVWRPYAGVPGVVAFSNGAYAHEPLWYRRFLYEEERSRGLDHVEDLASPGAISFDLATGEAALVLAADLPGHDLVQRPAPRAAEVEAVVRGLRTVEAQRRAAFAGELERAADAYVVQRGDGRTVVAGYPWFTDWGRDTFIAMRGLCTAAGRLAEAKAILLEWAAAVSDGMLPNRFPDRGDEPEFNAVDASLWYVVAVHEYLAAAVGPQAPSDEEAARLRAAVSAIVEGYAVGTRHGIAADGDGLLRAGEEGWQLTWMDARVGAREITPRIGKPVEIQALWINALRIAASLAASAGDVESGRRLGEAADRAGRSFSRFWIEERGHLYDVIDAGHVRGAHDASLRPNQILAVGGLPFAALEGERARRVVEVVEQRLLTPLGLRTLAPGEPGYAGRCEGGVAERDGAYHQGTVWPWLLGPFVEAWVRVRGGTAEARREAAARFLEPLEGHLRTAGMGHVSEIADGDAPHTPRGCPFQAWSLGELIRLRRVVRAERPDRLKERA